MQSPLESFLHEVLARLCYEAGRGRVLGYAITQPVGDPSIIWWMPAPNTDTSDTVEAVRTAAMVAGLVLTPTLAGDPLVSFYATTAPYIAPTVEDILARFDDAPKPLPTPPKGALDKGRGDWSDDDQLTRAEAAARLGISDRHLRTLSERGDVRVERKSRKTHRYLWGEVREDWAKLGRQA